MNAKIVRSLFAATVTLGVTACGGGGGSGLASTPPPASSPSTSLLPAPTTGPSGGLIAPLQSGSAVMANPDGTRIWDFPYENVPIRVTQTAVDKNFHGDGTDTQRVKVFYPNLIGDGPFLSYAGGGWGLGETVAPDQLDWTAFGYWDPFRYSGLPNVSRGAWLAGLETSVQAIPTTGSATYSGTVLGLVSESHICQCTSVAELAGSVNLSADFSARAISGAMTDLTVNSQSYESGPMNDISFSATLMADSNMFTGTTMIASSASGLWAMDPAASGDLTGHFFGPVGQEVGAVWTLSDGVHNAIGAFGARKDP